MRHPPTLRVLTVIAVLAATMLAPAAVYPDGMFSGAAVLDATQVVYISGERWCPEMYLPETHPRRAGMCVVGLVEGPEPMPSRRLDWNEAFRKCLSAGYTDAECEESVRDGEF